MLPGKGATKRDRCWSIKAAPGAAKVRLTLVVAEKAGQLALHDGVNLEHIGLSRELDPSFGQHRHELLSPRLELLAGVPDLADHEVSAGTEADVVVEPLRGKADLLNLGIGRVVLLGGQVGRVETHNDAHG